MTWATDRRLDYIDWRLATHGEVQRSDLVDMFGVSIPQASADISAFMDEHPRAMRYDLSRKRYIKRGIYKRQRTGIWQDVIDWARIDPPPKS